jgi:hypothetical protein
VLGTETNGWTDGQTEVSGSQLGDNGQTLQP